VSLSSLSNAVRKNKNTGKPLNEVWKTLTQASVVFRRGQLVVIGAAPGVGKSIFALRYMILSGHRGIYYSADSGARTQQSRAVSVLSGRPHEEVKSLIDQGYEFEDLLRPVEQRIWWNFSSGPDLDEIDDCVRAYGYLGAYPEIIVLDNLLDIDLGEATGAEHQNVENVLLFSKELARNTGALVMVLAHLTGEYENGTTPPPQGALRGKGAKIPEMVLNPYRDVSDPLEERFGIAIAKNREGIARADGTYTVSLKLDLSRMLIEDDPMFV
jgi:hypothetical protein